MKNAIKKEPCKLVCKWPSVSILCNKQTIITALLALVAMTGWAQEVTGRVIDEQSQPMAFADESGIIVNALIFEISKHYE